MEERPDFVLFAVLLVSIVLVVGLISAQEIDTTVLGGSTAIPPVIVVLPARGNITDLGIPLKMIGSTQNGRGTGPFESGVGFTTVFDYGHLLLTVSTGTLQNGTLVIYSKLTNIGHGNLTVGYMGIGGASPSGREVFDSYIMGGCTHNSTYVGPIVNAFPNGTVVTASQTFTVDCNQPDFQGTTIFSPGETFSAYVLVSPPLTIMVSSFGSGASYTPKGSIFTYSLQVNF